MLSSLLGIFRAHASTTVILTTHSPWVVDMSPIEDLLIVKKRGTRSIFKKVRNPDTVKKSLKEMGMTFSEGWLFGEYP